MNRLSQEKSPYLLQHANNPVDWYPWGKEALDTARTQNKPILLSIGYSACHWCHVMEHESFENEEIARLMNESFVCIKVDREERPDLDQVYQNVAQLMTHSGGWPLTVFLTPELKPFFGGTYFPPRDLYGRPGFPRVLISLANAYTNDPAAIAENANALTAQIEKLELTQTQSNLRPDHDLISKAVTSILDEIDWIDGGIGGAPKFPNTMALTLLWRFGNMNDNLKAREACILSLKKMACGGIFDQLFGGFHRYSVDARWEVPHFEKMLYDNGLLLKLYSEVLLTDKHNTISSRERALFIETLQKTLKYLKGEMISSSGLFFSAQDADSEGEEGKYFAWARYELKEFLSEPEMDAFAHYFCVSDSGNFENGLNVLQRNFEAASDNPDLKNAIKKALEVRKKRIRPMTDDKSLVAWNALMVSGLAWTSLAFDKSDDAESATLAREMALTAFDAMKKHYLTVEADGVVRLLSVFKENHAYNNAYLDDYSFFAMAALDLTRISPNPKPTLLLAEQLTDTICKYFTDSENGGFFFTSVDHEKLLTRPKTVFDQAIPSGTAITVECLTVLAETCDNVEKASAYANLADESLYKLMRFVERAPFGLSELINSAMLFLKGPLVISGNDLSIDVRSNPFVFIKKSDSAVIQCCHKKTCRDFGDHQSLVSFLNRISS